MDGKGEIMTRFTETLQAHLPNFHPHKQRLYCTCGEWAEVAATAYEGAPAHAAHVESTLVEAGVVAVDVQLIDELTDPDPCQWDHNHSCQAHGYFYLEQGVLCPQEEAKRVLASFAAAVRPVTPEEPR
jgi:hypothetical protein